jgi:hypothetical protein
MDPNDIAAALAGYLPMSAAGGPVVGLECADLLGTSGPLAATGIVHVRSGRLTAGFVATVRPACVILPLFAMGFDAMSEIEALHAMGYTGRIAVLAPPLPNPRLVEQELRALGPGARLVLISP